MESAERVGDGFEDVKSRLILMCGERSSSEWTDFGDYWDSMWVGEGSQK